MISRSGTLAAVLLAALSSGPAGADATSGELAAITNAAGRGNQGAQLLLGLSYLEGRDGLKPDAGKAYYWLGLSAQEGQAYAQYRVGRMAADGVGTAVDLRQAVEWWGKAAAQGQENAQLALGEAYLQGRGVKQDYAAAERWLGKAADQGNSRAQFLLGRMYHQGYGVARDLTRGKGWLERAAAQGNSDAIRFLNFLVDIGEDASLTHSQSREQLKQRAADGDIEAQVQLAMRYETGAWDVLQSDAKALYWFNKAADRGDKLAMRSLADIYERGLLGVKPDPRRAAALRARAGN